MHALIDDLLTLAREGDRVGDPEPVALRSLVETCWSAVDTRDATLDARTDRTIEADRSRLQQLLENLIRNAVEHGGDDVTVTVGDLDDGFYVEDDGPGIPPEDRDRLLEPGHAAAEGGLGFGLTIVREIAEAHGWSIHIVEGSSGGARIEVTGVTVVE